MYTARNFLYFPLRGGGLLVTAVMLRIEHIAPPGEPANAAGPTPENLILGILSKAHRFIFPSSRCKYPTGCPLEGMNARRG